MGIKNDGGSGLPFKEIKDKNGKILCILDIKLGQNDETYIVVKMMGGNLDDLPGYNGSLVRQKIKHGLWKVEHLNNNKENSGQIVKFTNKPKLRVIDGGLLKEEENKPKI